MPGIVVVETKSPENQEQLQVPLTFGAVTSFPLYSMALEIPRCPECVVGVALPGAPRAGSGDGSKNPQTAAGLREKHQRDNRCPDRLAAAG